MALITARLHTTDPLMNLMADRAPVGNQAPTGGRNFLDELLGSLQKPSASPTAETPASPAPTPETKDPSDDKPDTYTASPKSDTAAPAEGTTQDRRTEEQKRTDELKRGDEQALGGRVIERHDNDRRAIEKSITVMNQIKTPAAGERDSAVADKKEKVAEKEDSALLKKQTQKKATAAHEGSIDDVKRLLQAIDTIAKTNDNKTEKTAPAADDTTRFAVNDRRGRALPEAVKTAREAMELTNVKRFLDQENVNPRTLLEMAKGELRNNQKTPARSGGSGPGSTQAAPTIDQAPRTDAPVEAPRAVRFTPASHDSSLQNQPGMSSPQTGMRRADAAPAAPLTPARAEGFIEQVQQMMNRARVTVLDEKNGSFTVRLYPEKLGSVNVNIGLEQGVIHGKFMVENEDARQALMSSMDQLKADLRDAGITVGEFQVHVNDHRERFMADQREERPLMVRGDAREETTVAIEQSFRPRHEGSIDVTI